MCEIKLGRIENLLRKEHSLKNKKLEKILIAFFACTAAASFLWAACTFADAEQSREAMNRLAPVKSDAVLQTSSLQQSSTGFRSQAESSQPPSILPQFQSLCSQNSDLCGWLSIEGTGINYPVMFTPNDSEYYLHRNFKKQKEDRGLPFLEAQTDLLNSTNYLIYGHNMKDGTIFAGLKRYQSKSYYQAHPAIRFDTIYRTGLYQIIAVFHSQIYYENQDVFKYYKFYGSGTSKQFEDYVANVKKLSFYDTGVSAVPGEQLITLSTCSSYTQDGRLAVVAKRISS